MGKIKVIDAICYNGEPILELRLKYLYDVVDEFIIVESLYTHSNKLKPNLFLDINNAIIEPYKDKVTKLIINKFPDTDSNHSWIREQYQRDYIYNNYLSTTYQDQKYLLFCCDVDEIPRKELYLDYINLYNKEICIHIGMRMFHYSFNWLATINQWYHPFIINNKHINEFSLSDFRIGKSSYECINNSGWHCSYFETINNLIRKLESFAHTEHNKKENKNKEHIKLCLLTGRHFLSNRGIVKLLRNNNLDLPTGWEEFQSKLDDSIYQEEIS